MRGNKYNGGRKGIKVNLTWFSILSFTIGFISGYINGGFSGSLAGFIIALLILVISPLGLVPFVGILLYVYTAGKLEHTIQAYINMAGRVTYTTLYWLGFISALLLTVVTSLLALMVIIERRKGF